MNPIIEKVARSICVSRGTNPDDVTFGGGCVRSDGTGDTYVHERMWFRHKETARAAIKATLEQLRDNVSSEMELAGLKAGNYANDGETMKSEFRAMIMQALAEIDA